MCQQCWQTGGWTEVLFIKVDWEGGGGCEGTVWRGTLNVLKKWCDQRERRWVILSGCSVVCYGAIGPIIGGRGNQVAPTDQKYTSEQRWEIFIHIKQYNIKYKLLEGGFFPQCRKYYSSFCELIFQIQFHAWEISTYRIFWLGIQYLSSSENRLGANVLLSIVFNGGCGRASMINQANSFQQCFSLVSGNCWFSRFHEEGG